MGKLVFEKNFKIHWVPSIANKATPLDTEIAGGVNVTPHIPSDGWAPSRTQNKSSTAMMDSAYVSQRMGTRSDDLAITFTRDDVDFAIWDLWSHAEPGFLVASPFGAPEVDSRVEVYPVEASEPAPLASGENEDQKYEVQFAVTDEPEFNAVVTAGV